MYTMYMYKWSIVTAMHGTKQTTHTYITLVHKVRASAVSQSPVTPASDVVTDRHSTVPPHTVTGECASSLLKLAVTQELVHCVYMYMHVVA